MLFSERQGLVSMRSAVQVAAMDARLRTALWNVIYDLLAPKLSWSLFPTPLIQYEPGQLRFWRTVWVDFLCAPLDEMPQRKASELAERIKLHLMTVEWYRVYDLLEAAILAMRETGFGDEEEFRARSNVALEREMAGYRLLDATVVPVTDENELQAVDDALEALPESPAQVHLLRALQLMSDREAPDYRNSIKESISAVEALARELSGDEHATLGAALKAIESGNKLHPALKSAFVKLYGYTSDADGIRHALLEESNLDQADARFMLVACSAFVNYLLAKSTTPGQ